MYTAKCHCLLARLARVPRQLSLQALQFLKLGVPFWGPPIIRTIVYWGLYWGPPNYLGKLPNEGKWRMLVPTMAASHILRGILEMCRNE